MSALGDSTPNLQPAARTRDGLLRLPVRFDPERYEQSIGTCFEWIVREQGDVPAVRTADRSVSYQQLDRQANQVAHCLADMAWKGGQNVAVLTGYGPEGMAALIGTLKAGRICAPLDPAAPDVLLRSMILNASIGVLICDRSLRSTAEDLAEDTVTVVCLPDDAQTYPNIDPGVDVRPEQAACLLYSSGSTGTPKGIEQPHRNLLRNALGHIDAAGYMRGDRMTQFAATGSGQGMVTVLSCLLSGATLQPYDIRREGIAGLTEWMRHSGITVCTMAATLFRSWVETLDPKDAPPDLRLIRLGSEAVRWHDYELYRDRFPDRCRLTVAYSTSECGHIAFCGFDHDTRATGDLFPIGFEGGGVEVEIWDQAGNPLPDGQVGEFVVRGRYITPGYWRRPDLTRDVLSPCDLRPGAQCYRTGDLGRRNPDGVIEFTGRRNLRVSIRGANVELSEVEDTLRGHPSVVDVVADLQPDASGRERLVAWVMAADQKIPTKSELRVYLAARLAPNAVPSEFVLVESFPLTPAGKADRQSIVRDNVNILESNQFEGREPATETERALLAMWEDLLAVPSIGVDDAFFDLGGDSLVAGQMLARVRDGLGTIVPMHWFFENPTIAKLATRIAGPTVKIPAPAGAEEVAPLSFGQLRQWFLYHLDPSSAAYNTARAYRLKGALDTVALRSAMDRIVARHGSLRTTFEVVDDQPLQRIGPVQPAVIRELDLRDGPAETRETRLDEVLNEEIVRPFRLESDPPHRVAIIRLADDEWVLITTLHHIVSDRWSRWVLTRELSECYEAATQGRVPQLPDLPIQYADYARAQRDRVNGAYRESLLEYWREQLAPPLPPLDLATDMPRPKMLSGNGATIRFVLEKPLTDGLKQIGRRVRCTLYMTTLALFKVLLYRYSGNPDVVVGSTIANRRRTEEEPLIGFLVNSLVMRSDAGDDVSFLDFLTQVRNTALDAFDHQDAPFEMLVEELQPTRDPARNPLFQAMFNFANTPWQGLALPGVKAEPLEVHSQAAMFDLTLSLNEDRGALHGRLEYSTDLFRADTAERMTHHYRELARSAVMDPGQRISRLDFIDAAEREQLLAWGRSGPDEGIRGDAIEPIHVRIERHAKRDPDAVALIFEDTELSYGELDRRADRVAHRLISMGVEAETLVGICLERSPEMVVGLLGILKAGGAYLPLDPDYPPRRLQLLVEDSGLQVLVTRGTAVAIPPDCGGRQLRLEEMDWTAAPEPEATRLPVVRPEQLAYVIYTSGTTGQPKGVAVEHRQVAQLLSGTKELFDFDDSDVWTLYHSYAFDFSVWELWGALTTGARLVIVPQADARSPDRFVELLRTHRVTVLNQTPSALELLVGFEETNAGRTDSLEALRYLILGGESLPFDLVRRWFVRHPPNRCRVINMYGITEATVHATYRPIEAHEVQSVSGSFIGRPLPSHSLHLLDPRGQRAPIGVPGEIHLGGGGVARGYLNRPSLTAERFVPDRFSHDPDARLYRTGDLARFTCSGDLEYLGRIDRQVKIRGFRVELGEIETVLSRHPGVLACAVIDGTTASGDKQLVGYFVADEEIDAATLKNHLGNELPNYMIPSALIPLDALPLTRNGKLDRSALPEPVFGESENDGFTDLEQAVSDVWLEVLSIDHAAPDSNFFELGGHSLNAMRIAGRLSQTFAIDVPIIMIFDAPTIRQQAAWIETQSDGTENG